MLNRDDAATSALLRDGGKVFGALAQSPTQLQGLIRNSNAVFASTAARNQELAAAIKAFPAFTVATRETVQRVHEFARVANPLINELRPAAKQLNPTLKQTVILAPELQTLLENLVPLTAASKAGVPAFEEFLNASVPWLTRLKPYLGNFVPIFNYINTYRRELAAFFANSTANTEATSQNITQTKLLHYLRISNPVNPEALSGYPQPAGEQPRESVHGPGRLSATFERSVGFSGATYAPRTPSRRLGRRYPLTSCRSSRTSTTPRRLEGHHARDRTRLVSRQRGSTKRSQDSNHCHEHGRRCSQNQKNRPTQRRVT